MTGLSLSIGQPDMTFTTPHLEPVALFVDQDAINCYADVTGDYNPIHVDPAFAATTEMGGVIAHGTMSLNLIWQTLERTLGFDAVANLELDIRFRRPVRVGDMVTAGGALNGDGSGYAVWARNQKDENVIEGTANLRDGGR